MNSKKLQVSSKTVIGYSNPYNLDKANVIIIRIHSSTVNDFNPIKSRVHSFAHPIFKIISTRCNYRPSYFPFIKLTNIFHSWIPMYETRLKWFHVHNFNGITIASRYIVKPPDTRTICIHNILLYSFLVCLNTITVAFLCIVYILFLYGYCIPYHQYKSHRIANQKNPR